MDRATFDATVDEEDLSRWLDFREPRGTSSNKVCVYFADGVWHRVITDERAGIMEASRRQFGTEEEALDDALKTARGLRDFLDYRA